MHQKITTDLVLVGGGHSHAIVLRQFAMAPIPGLRITLISPQSVTPYSGMLPGHLAGYYSYDDCHIDLRRLVNAAQGQFWVDEVTDLELDQKQIHCKHHPILHYDWLSIDIGSTPVLPQIPGVLQFGIPVKPWQPFLEQWQDWLNQVASSPIPSATLVIVGGGAGGVELAFNAQTRFQQVFAKAQANPNHINIHLIHRGAQILNQHNAWVQRRCNQLLQQRRIHLHLNESVTSITHHQLHGQSGLTLDFDRLFWVTGATAPSWIQKTGLATTEAGFIQVDDTLRSPSHPSVFAAGDVATMANFPRPKAGVFAVRQGKPLADNLRRAILGQPLQPFKPQRHFLSLIGTGTSEAIASWGSFPWGIQSPQLWRLKDWIDRKFMAQFSELPLMEPDPLLSSSNAETNPRETHCAGCGSKVSSSVLETVLNNLQQRESKNPHSDILIGLSQGDDAAVVQVPQGKAMVHTLDYFRSLINDPFIFGQICTHHALSDLYAMGAEPQTALAIATLPYGSPTKQAECLHQVLRGSLQVLEEAGATLVGGHTTEGSELVFGLACNGTVDPGKIIQKQGLQSDQVLVLTQPLGIGVLFAAQMQGLTKSGWIDQAIELMLQSNQQATHIAQSFGTSACTDITGFGLLGHLWEMVNASQISVELSITAIPLINGALEMSQQGIRSSLYEQNSRVKVQVTTAMLHHPHWPLLFDPQTSGGLIFSIPESLGSDCLSELRSHGYHHSQIIGRTLETQAQPSQIHICETIQSIS